MTIFGRFLFKGYVLSVNLYQSEKIFRVLKMFYEKIYVCENGCVLFRFEYAVLNYCFICNFFRYIVVDNGMGEKNQIKIFISVFRYLSIVIRF